MQHIDGDQYVSWSRVRQIAIAFFTVVQFLSLMQLEAGQWEKEVVGNQVGCGEKAMRYCAGEGNRRSVNP